MPKLESFCEMKWSESLTNGEKPEREREKKKEKVNLVWIEIIIEIKNNE